MVIARDKSSTRNAKTTVDINVKRSAKRKSRSLSPAPFDRKSKLFHSYKKNSEIDVIRALPRKNYTSLFTTKTMSDIEKTEKLDKREGSLGDTPRPHAIIKDKTECTTIKSVVKKINSSGIPLPLRHSAPVKPSPKQSHQCHNKPSSPGKGTLKSSTTTSLSSKVETRPEHSRRSLEIQFASKKRKLELMKRELTEKQKPVLDMYKALVNIKKSLDEGGKIVPLINIKVVEFDEKGEKLNQILAGGLELGKKLPVDPNLINDMKFTMKQIPLSLLEVCRSIMDKRAAIITLLETEKFDDKTNALKQIDLLKKESTLLEKHVEDAFASQEKQVAELLENWQVILNSATNVSGNTEEKLRKELAKQEKTLAEITADLQKAQMQLKETDGHHEILKAEEEIITLQEKIKQLETDLSMEKSKAHRDKSLNFEGRLKGMKQQIKDLEAHRIVLERKIDELNGQVRHRDYVMKNAEKSWEKEKADLVKQKKHEQSLVSKLTNDRQCLETRVKSLEEMSENAEKDHQETVAKLTFEVDAARQSAITSNEERDIMERKFEAIKGELVKLELQNKQAIDLVNNRKEFNPNEKDDLNTEKEVQLYTELLATKVALKASQDKLEQYAKEKLRFIDSIEQLSGNVDKNRQNIAKALLVKEEEISRLIHEKNLYEDSITKQKLEISSLQMSVSNLEERIRALQIEAQRETDQGLKKSLQEGRLKLEQALKRSLENEQRLLKFEHDIEQKTKQLNDMENLLKVRDGLIGMMKTKKDELSQENESLNQYAEQVRALLIQSRDESNQKNVVIQDLQGSLDSRNRSVQKLELKIKELEGTLSATNEKRYKLQDTIGTMEKELQSTKAHINQMADMQTRYATAGQDINFSDLGDGPVRIKISVS